MDRCNAYKLLRLLAGVGFVYFICFMFGSKNNNKDLTSKTHYKSWRSIGSMHNLPLVTPLDPYSMKTFPISDFAVCILTPFAPALDSTTWQLTEKIRRYAGETTTVFILSDALENFEVVEVKTNNVLIVGVDPTITIRHGFQLSDGFNIKKNVHAWDKFYFLFSKILLGRYKFVFAVEWDVHIPTREAYQALENSAFLSLTNFISSNSSFYDLVTPSEWANHDGHTTRIDSIKKRSTPDWHWQRVKNRPLQLPWFGSMMCVHGLSQQLLTKIKDYAALNGRLEFIEIFGITLAKQNNLTINHPPCLSTITFKAQWGCKDIQQYPKKLFHPVKNSTSLNRCL